MILVIFFRIYLGYSEKDVSLHRLQSKCGAARLARDGDKTYHQPMTDVATLRHILDTAIYPPFFRPNPKFGNEYELYFINYDNVMSDQLTIDGSNDTETALTSRYTLKGEPVVTYRSVEELVADGWQLD